MREIKFRGHNGVEWIHSECIYFNEFPTLNDRLIHMPNEDDENCDILNIETWDTVGGLGQYTGLKDRDGIEVYEGDILSHTKSGKEYICKVVYSNSGFYTHGINFRTINPLATSNKRVVGNIYENPELLGD